MKKSLLSRPYVTVAIEFLLKGPLTVIFSNRQFKGALLVCFLFGLSHCSKPDENNQDTVKLPTANGEMPLIQKPSSNFKILSQFGAGEIDTFYRECFQKAESLSFENSPTFIKDFGWVVNQTYAMGENSDSVSGHPRFHYHFQNSYLVNRADSLFGFSSKLLRFADEKAGQYFDGVDHRLSLNKCQLASTQDWLFPRKFNCAETQEVGQWPGIYNLNPITQLTATQVKTRQIAKGLLNTKIIQNGVLLQIPALRVIETAEGTFQEGTAPALEVLIEREAYLTGSVGPMLENLCGQSAIYNSVLVLPKNFDTESQDLVQKMIFYSVKDITSFSIPKAL